MVSSEVAGKGKEGWMLPRGVTSGMLCSAWEWLRGAVLWLSSSVKNCHL